LDIFSLRLASQHHDEAGNIQHEVGININMKLEIFSTRLASTSYGTLTDPKDLPRNQNIP
jgi:hypothetical protein